MQPREGQLLIPLGKMKGHVKRAFPRKAKEGFPAAENLRDDVNSFLEEARFALPFVECVRMVLPSMHACSKWYTSWLSLFVYPLGGLWKKTFADESDFRIWCVLG